jgi:hypothetical protein
VFLAQPDDFAPIIASVFRPEASKDGANEFVESASMLVAL